MSRVISLFSPWLRLHWRFYGKPAKNWCLTLRKQDNIPNSICKSISKIWTGLDFTQTNRRADRLDRKHYLDGCRGRQWFLCNQSTVFVYYLGCTLSQCNMLDAWREQIGKMDFPWIIFLNLILVGFHDFTFSFDRSTQSSGTNIMWQLGLVPNMIIDSFLQVRAAAAALTDACTFYCRRKTPTLNHSTHRR